MWPANLRTTLAPYSQRVHPGLMDLGLCAALEGLDRPIDISGQTGVRVSIAGDYHLRSAHSSALGVLTRFASKYFLATPLGNTSELDKDNIISANIEELSKEEHQDYLVDEEHHLCKPIT